MRPLISFMSDFGLADGYVAAVKGVILGLAQDAAIVDVTHEVAPQAIVQAVFLAEQAWPYFPEGTVHLVVVDPGVGTDRPGVALRTPTGYVVGPDNGVLSAALPAEIRRVAAAGYAESTRERCLPAPRLLPVPDGFALREIRSQAIVRRPPSATFHGRDIFAPAAAYLAAGGDFPAVGPPRDHLLVLPLLRGTAEAEGVAGVVLHVDRFGNLISTVHAEQLPGGARTVEILGRNVPLVRTYGEGEGLVALVGSSGYVEVARVNGSAAAELRTGVGTPVLVRVR